ncbi:hypothetical protein JZ751_001952 [Albula glossodonta]|uniref:PID domain-containing protein n=1 Tax=Albula glossodonta TaxID=121402 RepID=A0A8T2PHE1_9TELE|nr:hypothetical protein JZ751_001952 [Albula glossodonta]
MVTQQRSEHVGFGTSAAVPVPHIYSVPHAVCAFATWLYMQAETEVTFEEEGGDKNVLKEVGLAHQGRGSGAVWPECVQEQDQRETPGLTGQFRVTILQRGLWNLCDEPPVSGRHPAACVFAVDKPPAAGRQRKTFLLVTYLGKVTISGSQFLSGCTESAVSGLCERRPPPQEDALSTNAILEIRPFQVRLHHLDGRGEATVAMDTYQVARIAYCTADHNVSPNVFAWIYREINDDLTFQMDCHAVECENKLEAKRLAHSMMEAFRKTFQSMRSDGRIHKSCSSDEFPEDSTPDDG